LKARLTGMLSATLLTVCLGRGQNPGNSSSLSISPVSVLFPVTPVGAEVAPQTVMLANMTSSNVQLQEIIVSGIDFAQSNDCGQHLAAAAKCRIQVVFKPVISGERLGNLEIVSSASSIPYFVPLTGIGQ
jgi:hypothetical protein